MKKLFLTINYLMERAKDCAPLYYGTEADKEARSFTASQSWANAKAFIIKAFTIEAFSSELERMRGKKTAFKNWMLGLSAFSAGATNNLNRITDTDQQETEFINCAYCALFEELPSLGAWMAGQIEELGEVYQLQLLNDYAERNGWNCYYFENEATRILEELGADYSPENAFYEVYQGAKSGDYNINDSYAYIDDCGHLISFNNPLEYFHCNMIDIRSEIRREPEEYGDILAGLIDFSGEPLRFAIVQECNLIGRDGSIKRDLMGCIDHEIKEADSLGEALSFFDASINVAPVDLPRISNGERVELVTYLIAKDFDGDYINNLNINGFYNKTILRG